MIIPLSEPQLRTYLDTGKVTVEIPSDCQWRADVEPKEHSCYPGLWMPYCSDGRVANGEPGDTEDSYEITAPVKVGDRVDIGEEFYLDRLDYELGRIPVRRPDNLDEREIYYRIDGECCAQIPECACVEVGEPEWSPPDIMPEWAARHHATVATIAFERRGDSWAWIVGLEAANAD